MGITYTSHYNLGKQETDTDRLSMDVITDNMDKIDTALYAKSDSSSTYTKTDTDTLLSGKIANVEKGANDGVATLDANGLIPMSQIPPTVMQRIATGTNLDTMTTQGDYYSSNSSDTASLVNCPFSGSGGKIKVETITPVFVMQTAIKGWSATTPSISVRGGQLTSGVWSFSPWYMVGLTQLT